MKRYLIYCSTSFECEGSGSLLLRRFKTRLLQNKPIKIMNEALSFKNDKKEKELRLSRLPINVLPGRGEQCKITV